MYVYGGYEPEQEPRYDVTRSCVRGSRVPRIISLVTSLFVNVTEEDSVGNLYIFPR